MKKIAARPDALAWALIAAAITLVIGLTLAFGGHDDAALPAGDNVAEVNVDIQDMRFSPSRIEVPCGAELVIHLTNSDTKQHDLKLGSGYSGRVDPGKTVSADFGAFDESAQGWCTIAGHKAMGMVLNVDVVGPTPEPEGAPAP